LDEVCSSDYGTGFDILINIYLVQLLKNGCVKWLAESGVLLGDISTFFSKRIKKSSCNTQTLVDNLGVLVVQRHQYDLLDVGDEL